MLNHCKAAREISDVKVKCLHSPKAQWHLFYMCAAEIAMFHQLIVLVLEQIFEFALIGGGVPFCKETHVLIFKSRM